MNKDKIYQKWRVTGLLDNLSTTDVDLESKLSPAEACAIFLDKTLSYFLGANTKDNANPNKAFAISTIIPIARRVFDYSLEIEKPLCHRKVVTSFSEWTSTNFKGQSEEQVVSQFLSFFKKETTATNQTCN
jgi:hypothetical protein